MGTDQRRLSMQIDKNAVNALLALDDARLNFLIKNMAQKIGLDLASFGLDGADINAVRQKLADITDAELELAQRQIDEHRKH